MVRTSAWTAVGGWGAAATGGTSTGGRGSAGGGASERLERGRCRRASQQNSSYDHELGRTTQSGVNDMGKWMRMDHEVHMGSHVHDASECTGMGHVRA